MSASEFVARLLWWTRLSSLARRLLAAQGRFVLVLHGVASRPHRGLPVAAQPLLTASDLDRILHWLSSRFSLLTAKELLEGGRAGVVLTFDDGLANNCTTVLPLLEKHRAPAVFFVSTQHVRQPDDWLPATRRFALLAGNEPGSVPREVAADLYDGLSLDQLRRCARSELLTIGSHTVTHPFLSRCSRQQLEVELEQSRSFLEEICEQPVDLLAYPTGDYDSRVLEAAARLGYRAGFAEEPRALGVDRFEIPRIGIYSSAPFYLDAKLSGLFRKPVGSLTETAAVSA